MVYTSPSGIPVPQGTDAFNPNVQLKAMADAVDAYNWVYTVADEAARIALIAPVLRDGLMVSQLSDNTVWVYTNPGWLKLTPGMTAIVPTSVAGSGVTLASDGRVSFAASSSVNINGLFAAPYTHILMDVNVSTQSIAGSVNLRVRLAGTDDSGTNYSFTQRTSNAGTTASTGVASVASYQLTGTGVAHFFKTDIWNLSASLATRMNVAGYTANTGGVHIDLSSSGFHGTGTAYDGLTLIPTAGVLTGDVKFYGYI
jgi:hypothetical protein